MTAAHGSADTRPGQTLSVAERKGRERAEASCPDAPAASFALRDRRTSAPVVPRCPTRLPVSRKVSALTRAASTGTSQPWTRDRFAGMRLDRQLALEHDDALA